MTMSMMATLKRQLRTRGWELRRTDPDRSLGEHLWFVFPYLGINCVLDVGAGRGEYGTFLRQNGYAGHIISFEPVAASFSALARRCADDPRWHAYPYALGSEHSARQIFVTSNPDYSSFLQPSQHALATFPGCAVDRTERVEVRRLDEIFDDAITPIAEPRAFLKLTTQGWDLEVLRGAEHRLDRLLAMQTELSLHPPYEGATEFEAALSSFSHAGFAAAGMFDRPHHHGFRLAEVDFVAIKPASPASHVVRRW
jgi:FkbM family methyltransferase